jgi:valyl-tRNA synthetase
MLFTSPAGNDLPFDESLCEQGRNFNNKIWNAFRLVKGWKVADTEQPESAAIAVKWFDSRLSSALLEIDDLFSKFRLSEALMTIYKLFWDEFSSWYLEMIKPAYQQPIDKKTYEATLRFFDALLKALHPYMPFITEELWQALEERKEGESIMISLMPEAKPVDELLTAQFDKTKEIIAGIRTIRLQYNIPNKNLLQLEIIGEHNPIFDSVILKLCNLEHIQIVNERSPNSISFLVGTTEYAVPMDNLLDAEEEIKKMEDEIVYLEGFIELVMKKLGNEKFVANAKPQIVEAERKKHADALGKIESLRESIMRLKEK